MDPIQQATILISQANAILARSERDATWWKDARWQAQQISDFLAEYGSGLDAGGSSALVDVLGRKFDELAAGATLTLGDAQGSAFITGVKQFVNDETSLDNSIADGVKQLATKAGEAANEGLKGFLKTPGGKVVAALVVLGVLGYFWRAVR